MNTCKNMFVIFIKYIFSVGKMDRKREGEMQVHKKRRSKQAVTQQQPKEEVAKVKEESSRKGLQEESINQ